MWPRVPREYAIFVVYRMHCTRVHCTTYTSVYAMWIHMHIRIAMRVHNTCMGSVNHTSRMFISVDFTCGWRIWGHVFCWSSAEPIRYRYLLYLRDEFTMQIIQPSLWNSCTRYIALASARGNTMLSWIFRREYDINNIWS